MFQANKGGQGQSESEQKTKSRFQLSPRPESGPVRSGRAEKQQLWRPGGSAEQWGAVGGWGVRGGNMTDRAQYILWMWWMNLAATCNSLSGLSGQKIDLWLPFVAMQPTQSPTK